MGFGWNSHINPNTSIIMSHSIISTYKAFIASQKQTLETQLITQEKLLQMEAANARIEASLARIEADIALILAKLQAEDEEATFADLVRCGEEDVDAINDYIAAYKDAGETGPLHEYLGLSSEELVALLERPEDVDEILGIETPETE